MLTKNTSFNALIISSLVLVFIFSLSYSNSFAGQAEDNFKPRSFPQSNVESYSYKSDLMDQTYDISVSLPYDYDQNPDKKYPLLIVTDGNRSFSQAHEASTSLIGAIDQPIIVSIGVPFEEGQMAYVKRRVFEFSPENWDMKDDFGGKIKSRNYPNLIYISEIHQGLGHTDVVPVSLARGLRLLYAMQPKIN